ncbi:MAG: hypothetical protein ABL900_07415 [Burkholderiaceae bacterium]
MVNVNQVQRARANADKVDAAQLRYARLLEWGTRIGLVLLLLSFAGYISGVLPAQVAPQDLPQLWNKPLQRYLDLTGVGTGWSWLGQLQHGDVLGLAGIAVLAGCSGVALAAVLPIYRQRRDRAYTALCIALVAVLLLAASGLLRVGH